ncbi:MAG: tRNA-(guanine-N1)-methyltransferase, partial [Pseudomonadota bacterium]
HNWVFDLNTGEAQGADDGRITTYRVRVQDDRILLDDSAVTRRSAA